MDSLSLIAEQKIPRPCRKDSPVNMNSQQDYYRKVVERITLRSKVKK